jgi:hypothetical protein
MAGIDVSVSKELLPGLLGSPVWLSAPTWTFMPKCHWFPFFTWCISGSRAFSSFLVEGGAAISVASTMVRPDQRKLFGIMA